MRLRTRAAGQSTGVPSSCKTMRPIAFLPGVAPSAHTSNAAGASHSSRKAKIRMKPQPKAPSMPRVHARSSSSAARRMKSISQAMARGKGPASRNVSSMPSGVGIARIVSRSARDDTRRPESVPVLIWGERSSRSGEKDVAIGGVRSAGKHRQQHQPAESEGYRGENREDEHDHSEDGERHQVLQAAPEAALHRLNRRDFVQRDQRRGKPEGHEQRNHQEENDEDDQKH